MHFREAVAPALSGHFVNEFWTTLLPQLCHTEPAVLHAVQSLSASHRRFVMKVGPDLAQLEGDAFELRQYNRAITQLRSRASTSDADLVVVACCLLFTCFECLYGNQDLALTHLKHGLDIVKTTGTPFWASEAQKILHRFSTQSVLFGNIPQESTTFEEIVGPAMEVNVPQSFKGLTEAQAVLDILIAVALRFSSKVRQYTRTGMMTAPPHGHHDRLIQKYRSWESAFIRLRATTAEDDTSEARFLDLWIRYRASSIWIHSCLRKLETDFDAYKAEFSDIIECAGRLTSISSPNINSLKSTAFTFDHGNVSAIFLVALKCRYASIRMKAIDIMYALPAREGLWDTRLSARAARRIMEIETTATQEQSDSIPGDLPPEHCRVFTADIMEDQGQGYIHFHMRPEGHGGPIVDWKEDISTLPQ
ncbi:fungal specific transcription factor domain-containing protein 49 [Elsinoe australis]|uniref:Fungal specific transcription factor domain-containing protein 49 n=1 Tax=Elsinoe australis TaxID=40998 RepID=A0A4U7AUQ6_9PEZI|nr:fungal specific transcription factor domain-containing protein 49 [Elsinoe australis]